MNAQTSSETISSDILLKRDTALNRFIRTTGYIDDRKHFYIFHARVHGVNLSQICRPYILTTSSSASECFGTLYSEIYA